MTERSFGQDAEEEGLCDGVPAPEMRCVIVESPYRGDVERNLEYLRACLHDCFKRGEAPFASHGLYTQKGVLDDTVPNDRELGIRAGLAWGRFAEATVVYVDFGITPGMLKGMRAAEAAGRPIQLRSLPAWRNL